MSTKTIRPNYYNPDSIYEPIKIIQHYGLNFEISNCLKYCLRAGVKNKDTEQEDLIKAITYLQLRVEWLEAKKQGIGIKHGREEKLPASIESSMNTHKEGYHKAIEEFSNYSNTVLPKAIEDLKVGDKIRAIQECKMDEGCNALTIGKYYKINTLENNRISISSDIHTVHKFTFDDLQDYFHVTHSQGVLTSKEKEFNSFKTGEDAKAIEKFRVLTKENIQDIKDSNYQEGLNEGYH